MKTRHFSIVVSLLFLVCIPGYTQTGGYKKAEEQIGYKALELRYGYDIYKYTFSVRDGLVTWNYSGPNGNMNGRFQCNRFIAGDIVTSECSGVVHWYFAGRFVFEMVEEKGQFDGILYKWAMEALKSSMDDFEKGKKTSPDAYDRVQNAYLEIKKAEEGKGDESLWKTLCFYSYALNEHELVVSDLYNYDF